MNTRILLLLLIIGNQLKAQQNQYNPTKVDIDSIYARVENVQIENFLKTNPILIDISEELKDSIFLMLINNYRVSNGLNKLNYSLALDSACELHTYWMLKEQKVEHEEFSINRDGELYPQFTDRILKFDPSWFSDHKILFENCGAAKSIIGNDPKIQFKRITKESVYEIFNGWKTSPGHNAAMLNEHVKYLGFYLEGKYNTKLNNYLVLGTLLLSN
jgi:uncharacterized protein YkwD